jgi:hypothetical protein
MDTQQRHPDADDMLANHGAKVTQKYVSLVKPVAGIVTAAAG